MRAHPTFFTSDWHLGHKNIITYSNRPFTDVDHMHRVLINNFNATVPKHGLTYFLGDMGLCNIELISDTLKQLNGTHIIILGNHDKKQNAMLSMGFTAALYSASIRIANEIVTMSHCPLPGVTRENTEGMRGVSEGEHWHGESRHQKYTVPNQGQFHLSGHIHSPNGGKSRRELHRQYDVGVDANKYTPVSISMLESWVTIVKKKEQEWRDIPSFPGYKVNTFGQIKSFKRYSEGKIIRPYADKDGYLCAILRQNSKSKAIKVHRAVAIAFIPNPKDLPQVNHKNCNKQDNEVCNLEWVSNIDNQRHAWLNDRKTISLKVADVQLIKKLLSEGKSNTEIANNFGVDQSLISNIKTGKIWKGVT